MCAGLSVCHGEHSLHCLWISVCVCAVLCHIHLQRTWGATRDRCIEGRDWKRKRMLDVCVCVLMCVFCAAFLKHSWINSEWSKQVALTPVPATFLLITLRLLFRYFLHIPPLFIFISSSPTLFLLSGPQPPSTMLSTCRSYNVGPLPHPFFQLLFNLSASASLSLLRS